MGRRIAPVVRECIDNRYTSEDRLDWNSIEFEWDRHNAPKLAQEGFHRKSRRIPVYVEEVEEAFFNPHKFQGPKRVKREQRYYLWGSTDAGRLLFLVYVVKQTQPILKVRVFSARDMEPDEKAAYLAFIEEEYDAKEE